MATTKSFPTQDPSGISITDTRRVMAGLVQKNANGTPRVGVFPTGTDPLVTGRAEMAYDVAPFFAATSRIAPGIELIANDASTRVATVAAPASNSRLDVIWVRTQFLQHADGSNLVVFGVTNGAAALNPQKPAIPAGALELAVAEVPSSATTTQSGVVITQTHPYTAAAGGVVQFRNATELQQWAAPSGAQARDLATGALYQRDGANWVAPVAAGSVLIAPTAVSAGSGLTIVDGGVVAAGMPSTGGNIEGLFSSKYRAYEIVCEGTFPQNGGLQVALRTSTGTAGGTDYLNQYIYAVGGGGSTTVQNNLGFFAQSASGGTRFASRLRLTNPGAAVPTSCLTDCTSLSGTTVTQTRIAAMHNVAAAYTGIALSTSSGQAFTGTIKVYGLV